MIYSCKLCDEADMKTTTRKSDDEGKQIEYLRAEVEILKTELGRALGEGCALLARAETAEEDLLRIGEDLEDIRRRWGFFKPEHLTPRERTLLEAINKIGEPRESSA